MKVQREKLEVSILDLTGKPVVVGEGGPALRMIDAISQVLVTGSTKDDPASKLQKFKLAVKLTGTDPEIELTPEDNVLIKKAVGESNFIPLVYGRVCDFIDSLQ